MTREQAKSELMQIYGALSPNKQQALDVAFKAMEQADGEYINRIKAIGNIEDDLCKDIESCDSCPFKDDAYCKVALWLKQLPTVAIPNKTGHWECDELFYEGESRGAIIKCSECGNELKVSPKVFENLYDNERFCNHCGAKMGGEQHG